MIQINELRIGNLIRVNGILSKIEIINNELDEVYFLGEDFYHSDFCCNIEPIPITKEWLLKFGFLIIEINGKFEATLPNFRYNIYWNKYTDGFLFCDGETVLINFNYVHELQNLVFVLGQRELTVA